MPLINTLEEEINLFTKTYMQLLNIYKGCNAYTGQAEGLVLEVYRKMLLKHLPRSYDAKDAIVNSLGNSSRLFQVRQISEEDISDILCSCVQGEDNPAFFIISYIVSSTNCSGVIIRYKQKSFSCEILSSPCTYADSNETRTVIFKEHDVINLSKIIFNLKDNFPFSQVMSQKFESIKLESFFNSTSELGEPLRTYKFETSVGNSSVKIMERTILNVFFNLGLRKDAFDFLKPENRNACICDILIEILQSNFPNTDLTQIKIKFQEMYTTYLQNRIFRKSLEKHDSKLCHIDKTKNPLLEGFEFDNIVDNIKDSSKVIKVLKIMEMKSIFLIHPAVSMSHNITIFNINNVVVRTEISIILLKLGMHELYQSINDLAVKISLKRLNHLNFLEISKICELLYKIKDSFPLLFQQLSGLFANSFADIGRKSVQDGRFYEGIACIESAIKLDPNYMLYNTKAFMIIQQSKESEAIEYLTKSINHYVKFGMAYYNRGLLRKKVNDFSGAVKDFEIVTEIWPFKEQIWFTLSELKECLGDYKGASISCEKAIRLQLKKHQYAKLDSWIRLGKLKVLRRDFTGAIKVYTECIELYPAHSNQAYLFRGMLYFETDEIINAASDLEIAVVNYPEVKTDLEKVKNILTKWREIEIFNNEGIKAFNSKNFKHAIKCFDQALTLYDKHSGILRNRGTAKFQMGNLYGALADLNSSVESNPSNVKAYIRRGEIFLKMNNFKRALYDFKFAEELDPQNSQIQFKIQQTNAIIAEKITASVTLLQEYKIFS